MTATRRKFATQVDTGLLSAIRAVAETEGRQLQSVVDEAFADLIEKRRNAKPHPHVVGAYFASIEKYESLYKKLAE